MNSNGSTDFLTGMPSSSDQAPTLLGDATEQEQQVLGDPYGRNGGAAHRIQPVAGNESWH
ncbi:hypothetical protein O9993_09465 [Vibrio lentus]|nr:hypothetical protein [Vibrio lentus]